MVNFRLLILQKLTRKKTLMARLQEDRDIGTEDLLSSGLIPSCPSFTWKDRRRWTYEWRRSAQKHKQNRRKRWLRGFQRLRKASLLSGIVSPWEYRGWLKAIVFWIPWSNAGQFLSMAPLSSAGTPSLGKMLVMHWKMKLDCCKKVRCYVWSRMTQAHLLTWEPKGTRHHNHQTPSIIPI